MTQASLIPTADYEKRDNRRLIAFGRLAEGVTLRSSSTEMETIQCNLDSAYPLTNRNFVSVVLNFNVEFYKRTRIHRDLCSHAGWRRFRAAHRSGGYRQSAIGFRAASRAREISIRIAVGASQRHLIRKLLIESLVLSAVGGVLGWLLGKWGLRILLIYSDPVRQAPMARLLHGLPRSSLSLLLSRLARVSSSDLAPALRLLPPWTSTRFSKDGGRGSF